MPPSPQFGQLVPLFFKRQKRRFKRHSKAETKNNAKSDKKVNYYQKFIKAHKKGRYAKKLGGGRETYLI